MLLHPDPKRVMVVGVGAGQTPARFLMYGVDHLDAVDIEPAVFDLIGRHFPTEWMKDPRVATIRADGRNVLTHARDRYDVISIEVGQIFRPGVGAFYTRDFYRLASERLEPGGLLSQFVPLSFLPPEAFGSVIATFLEVFPNSVLWYNTSELLLIGTAGDRLELADSRLRLLTENAEIEDDLRYGYWGGPAHWLHRPEALLGGFLCGPRGLAALAAGAPICRDDRPVLEYATPGHDPRRPTEIEDLAKIRQHLDPFTLVRPGLRSDAALAVEKIRGRNLGDLHARSLLRRVPHVKGTSNHAAVVELLGEAVVANPDNAEVRRVLGDALLSLDRLAEAEEHYRRALELRGDDALAHRGLGFALHRQDHAAEAIAEYRRALELGGDDAEVHYNLGAALGQLGDLDAALGHFARALELRPGFQEAERNLEQVRAAIAASRSR
jgi:spermidine synthase